MYLFIRGHLPDGAQRVVDYAGRIITLRKVYVNYISFTSLQLVKLSLINFTNLNIYIYIPREREMCIYIYIYTHTYIHTYVHVLCIHIYIYIYIYI